MFAQLLSFFTQSTGIFYHSFLGNSCRKKESQWGIEKRFYTENSTCPPSMEIWAGSTAQPLIPFLHDIYKSKWKEAENINVI